MAGVSDPAMPALNDVQRAANLPLALSIHARQIGGRLAIKEMLKRQQAGLVGKCPVDAAAPSPGVTFVDQRQHEGIAQTPADALDSTSDRARRYIQDLAD